MYIAVAASLERFEVEKLVHVDALTLLLSLQKTARIVHEKCLSLFANKPPYKTR